MRVASNTTGAPENAAMIGSDRMSGDQSVVAEAHAALGDQNIRIARAGDLGDHILHVLGRQELALLHIDHLAGMGGGDQKVGLAAEESGNLQHIHGLGHGGALIALMHIGQNRQTEMLANLREDRQSPFQPQPPLGVGAGAIGLVETGFINQADAGLGAGLFQGARHVEGMGAAFQLARSGDDGELQVIAELNKIVGRPEVT